MTNINKIVLVVINLDLGGTVPSIDLFDYHVFTDDNLFIGLAIDNPNLRFELEDCGDVNIYDPTIFANLFIRDARPMLDYIGFTLDVDDILDIMLDEEVDLTRKFYLETILYYKSNQEGKELKKYKLNVKHFDDLIHNFGEDFVAYEVLNNNDDYSESEIILETYLTNKELKEKFKNYLI